MLNGNDLELLSAYLDGALSEQERAALEARLQTDAELRRELARLRATVDLVKALPMLSSPRPLTLTPRMVRRPTIWTSAAFSAFSTAAAVILLVIGASLFTTQQSAAPAARNAVAFAPTAAVNEPNDGFANSNTAAQPPLVADDFQATLQKATEEIALQSGALDLAAPTGTALPTNEIPAPLAYAAVAPSETANIEGFSADASAAQSQPSEQGDIDQQRTQQEQQAQQAAPSSMAGGGLAAQPPQPAPTLGLPTATSIPTKTATITPSNTASPTNTAANTPSPAPTLAPTPVPIETPTAETSTVGIGLIVVALILFGVAIVTTILRRRL
jgi:hypothetical protein